MLGFEFEAMQKVAMTLFVLGGVLAAGCDKNTEKAIESSGGSEPEAVGRPKVVATTTIVADLVANVAGDAVELVRLMPPGTDPHRFTLTALDNFELRTADAIFYNGLGLESEMQSTFEQLNARGVMTVAVSEGIPADRIILWEGSEPDPHIWGDPTLWAECVEPVAEALKTLLPHAVGVIDLRANSYRFELNRLHNWIKEQVERVPWQKPRRRVLVTSHDRFGYWGKVYQFDILSLRESSTSGEPDVSEIEELGRIVKDKGVPVVFSETTVSADGMKQVAANAKVKFGESLYSDSVGGDFQPSFKLRLLEVGSAEELPKAGVGHMFLGRFTDGRIHVRVFDSKGFEIFDRAEKEISGNKQRIAQLKKRLKSSWSKGYVVDGSDESVVREVKSIIGYRAPGKNSMAAGDPGPERSLPLTGENIDVRTYVGMMKFNAYKIASGLKAGITPSRLHQAAKVSADNGLAPDSTQ